MDVIDRLLNLDELPESCEAVVNQAIKEITRLRAKLAESQKWEAVFRRYFDDSQAKPCSNHKAGSEVNPEHTGAAR